MKDEQLPPDPGTSPVPEGHVRLWHYTPLGNVPSIREHGLQRRFARGDAGNGDLTDPSAGMWASTSPPHEILNHSDGAAAVVEFHAHPREISGNAESPWQAELKREPGQSWEDRRYDPDKLREWSEGRHHVIMRGSVPPEHILAIHEPWHHAARYMRNDDPTLQSYQWVKDDYAKGGNDHLEPYVRGLRALEGSLTGQVADPGPVTIRYAHNRERSPDMGEMYGQHVEPAGRYLVPRQGADSYELMPDKWTTGEITFSNPLHVPFGGGYRDPSNWKHVLSGAYGGLTGRRLSDALRAKGHDAVITHDEDGMSEVVDLTHDRHGNPLDSRTATLIGHFEAAVDMIDLYHHTSPEIAAKVYREKKMISKENTGSIFFTTDPDSEYAAGFGEGVVHVRMPRAHLERLDDQGKAWQDDEFPSGEQHWAIHHTGLRPEHFIEPSVHREAAVQHQAAGEIAPEGHQIWAVPAEGRSPVAAEVYHNMTHREPEDEHGSNWYQGISYHGPYHVIRHPQTRQVWLVDRHGRDASITGGHYGNPEKDGSWGEHQAWKHQYGLESAGPEAHRFGTWDEPKLNEMDKRVPEFPHSRVDPEDEERVRRPEPRVHAPEGHSPSEEYHGSYEVVRHPETNRFHVVDNAGRSAHVLPLNGFETQLQAERSRDYTEKRQRSKEIGRGIADSLWDKWHEALDPGGTAESRQSEENMRTASEMMDRYHGGLGEIKFDSDEEGGAPYYEREHLLDSGRPSGWYAKHYGGAQADIYHRATGDESHAKLDLPQHPEDENRVMIPRLHPQFGDEHLAGELRDWHDDEEGREREYIEANDPRIARWRRRHLGSVPEVVAHFEEDQPDDEEGGHPAVTASAHFAALVNPHTGGQDWYHGSPYSFGGDFSDGNNSPLEFEQDPEDTSHWNTLLGNHFAASHRMAEEFSKGEHGNSEGHGEEGPARNVLHARLELKNPKVYPSEHDMDQEAYEHEWRAGNHHDNYHDPDERAEAEEDGWEDELPRTYRYADHDDRMRAQSEGDAEYAARGTYHPYATGWLNAHPDKFDIAMRHRQRLIDAGHDGIVYGNEFEKHHGTADQHHVCAIPFHARQINVTQRHTGEHCVHPDEASRQWPGRDQPMLPGFTSEGSFEVVAHFEEPKTAAGPWFQQKLFHQQPDNTLHAPGSMRHNPADPKAGVRHRQEHEEAYEQPPETWDDPEKGNQDDEGRYRHPVHGGYYCHACSDYQREPVFHDDAETAENHDTARTDWDEEYPRIPATVYRGLRIDGGAHLADHPSPEHVARAILHHVGDDHMHWTGDEEQARHYAVVGTGGRGGPADLNVVLHARKPAREDIETDPETLADRNVYGIGHHDDEEIPLRSGAPVHITGVTWRGHGHGPMRYPDTEGWQRHDFAAPAEHTAALEPGPDQPSAAEERGDRWHEYKNNNDHLHRGIHVELPEDLHSYVHDESQPREERAQALQDHFANSGEGLGMHWTPHVNIANRAIGNAADAGHGLSDGRLYRGPSDATTTDVMFHATTGERNRLPAKYHDEHDIGRTYSQDEDEFPVRPGAPMRLHGISWRLHEPQYPNEPFEHVDFPKPMRHLSSARSTDMSTSPVPAAIEVPGGQVRPGMRTNRWGDEGERSQRVHFTTRLDTARTYAREAGGHVYEVEPTGHVTMGYDGDEWKSEHPLNVIRRVPDDEEGPAMHTASAGEDACPDVFLHGMRVTPEEARTHLLHSHHMDLSGIEARNSDLYNLHETQHPFDRPRADEHLPAGQRYPPFGERPDLGEPAPSNWEEGDDASGNPFTAALVAHFTPGPSNYPGVPPHFDYYRGLDRESAEPRLYQLEEHLGNDHVGGNTRRGMQQVRDSVPWDHPHQDRQIYVGMDALHRQAHESEEARDRSGVEHGAPEEWAHEERQRRETAHHPHWHAEEGARMAHEQAVEDHRHEGIARFHGENVEFADAENHLQMDHGISRNDMPEYHLPTYTHGPDTYQRALEDAHGRAHSDMGTYRHDEGDTSTHMHGQYVESWDAEHHLVSHHGYDIDDLRRDEPDLEREHDQSHERDERHLSHPAYARMDEDGRLEHTEGYHDDFDRGRSDDAFEHTPSSYIEPPRDKHKLFEHLMEHHGVSQSADSTKQPGQSFLIGLHDKFHSGEMPDRGTPHQHDYPEGHDPVFGSASGRALVAHFGERGPAVPDLAARDTVLPEPGIFGRVLEAIGAWQPQTAAEAAQAAAGLDEVCEALREGLQHVARQLEDLPLDPEFGEAFHEVVRAVSALEQDFPRIARMLPMEASWETPGSSPNR